MKLTVLGSGTMMPVRKRYPSSYLLDAGGSRLLLDCGHVTLSRLIEQGIACREIQAVCITHFHTDHFGGLLPFVHALWVDTVMTQRHHTPLTIIGPETLGERWEKLREVYWPEPSETPPLQFAEGATATTIGTISLETFPVKHVPWFPSVGYRLTSNGRTLVYTGDIGSDHPVDDLIARVRGAHLLLIECGSIQPTPNHYTIEQILNVQQESGVPHVVITHVPEHHLPLLQSILTGVSGVTIAEDGAQTDV